jgi:hypothetical protein
MSFTIKKPVLSYNAEKALVKGIIIGVVSTLSYLLVVAITTPSLPAIAAINAAITVNSVIIFGLGIGIGTQVFLTNYSKGLGCIIYKKRKDMFGGAGSTALSSFFSFFSLVPLGCCGSWLFILSMLPTIFGSSLSVVLIQYSEALSYVGLGIVFGFAGLSAIKLRKAIRQIDNIKYNNKFQLNNNHIAEAEKGAKEFEFQ